MAATSRTLKVIFDGDVKKLVAAAGAARAALAGFDDQTKKINEIGDRLGATTAKLTKGFLVLGAGASAIQSTVGTVVALGGAVAELAPAALALPAVFGGAAAAIGTFKLAMSGVGDALKGDAEAMAKLTPNARSAVQAILAFKPAFEDLRRSVQDAFFQGLNAEIEQTGKVLFPILRQQLPKIASGFRDMAAAGIEAARTPLFQDSLTTITEHTSAALAAMKDVVADVVTGFAALGVAGAPVLDRLGEGVANLARKFRDWAQTGLADGSIAAAIENAFNKVKTLSTAVGNFGQAAANAFRAFAEGLGLGGGSGSPIDALEQLSVKLKALSENTQVQDFFRTLGETIKVVANSFHGVLFTALKELGPVLKELAPFIQELARQIGSFLSDAIKAVAPLLLQFAKFLSDHKEAVAALVPLIFGLAGAFKAFKLATAGFKVLKEVGDGLKAIKLGFAALDEGKMGKAGIALGGFIKAAAGAGVILLIADALDRYNLAVAGGDETKLGLVGGELHNILGALKELGTALITFDFSAILKDIGDEWDTLVSKFESGESPIGALWKKISESFQRDFIDFFSNAFTKIKDSFQTDFIDVFAALPGQVGTKLGEIGTAISDFFTVTIPAKLSEVGTAISNFFTVTIPGIFTTFKDTLVTKAIEAWDGFKQACLQKFDELDGDAQTLPGRIGTAIGSLIGILITKAIEAWDAFKLWTTTKTNEVIAYVTALPGRIGTALAALGSTLAAKATEAWDAFKTWTTTKTNEVIAFVTALPGRIGTALASLVTVLKDKAVAAWQQFKDWALRKSDESVNDAKQVPGKVGTALGELPGLLLRKAQEAWQSFKTAALAKINEVLADARAVPGKIVSAIGNLGSLLVGAGRAVIDGLLAGIKAGYDAMIEFVSGIADGIRRHKGPLPYDRTVLVDNGLALMSGLQRGIEQGYGRVQAFVSGVAPDLAATLGAAGSVSIAGARLAAFEAGRAQSSSAAPRDEVADLLRQLIAVVRESGSGDTVLTIDGAPIRAIAQTVVDSTNRTTARRVAAGSGVTF